MPFPQRLILILGDQLDLHSPALRDVLPATDTIIMIESRDEARQVWSHKAKIALFLSAMRHFAAALAQRQYRVLYIKDSPLSLADTLKLELQKKKLDELVCVEPGEWRLKLAITNLAAQMQIKLTMHEDDHFYCSHQQFANWAGDKKELRLEYFYRFMRKKNKILLDNDGNPEGGQWNFDQENRKPYPRKGPGLIDPPADFPPDAITAEVIAFVNTAYHDHPGSLDAFNWPVTRDQALQALDYFITYRLRNFGQYQDAMWRDTPFGWHSILSSALNLKLLNPREVIDAVIHAWKNSALDLASVEGFVRQILGWREFVRGMYYLDMPKMAEANFYQHQRALPNWYWTGRTGMACMQDAIGQTLKYGYAHHIQRLMITGNFALLAEVLPQAVCDWYLAVYVDAIEWVELPNTAGMALFANGARFTSKPYIASGAYIKRMSNYCDSCRYRPEVRIGTTACPITTLYWHFLIKHRAQLESNPRTRLMTAHLARLSEQERDAISLHAQTVLANIDQL